MMEEIMDRMMHGDPLDAWMDVLERIIDEEVDNRVRERFERGEVDNCMHWEPEGDHWKDEKHHGPPADHGPEIVGPDMPCRCKNLP